MPPVSCAQAPARAAAVLWLSLPVQACCWCLYLISSTESYRPQAARSRGLGLPSAANMVRAGCSGPPPGSAVFETLADRPLSGAVLDVPLTRGYATLGDGVLEFTDEEHGPSRLTFAADDVEARPPCPLLLACHRGSTVPSAGAERMPRVHEVLGAGDAGCVGRLPGARTADTCLAFSKRRSQGRRAYQHYGATTMLGQCRAPARLPFVGQPAQVAGLDP